jgi:hypothetical protein
VVEASLADHAAAGGEYAELFAAWTAGALLAS